ncbi:hypothetical protein MCELHM10_01430 [Paracoccaceae bacterium]
MDTSGDLILNFGAQDPNTSVVYNGISYDFTVSIVGNMLGSYPNGARVDPTLLNEQVVIIEFTDNLNVTHRVFFYPNETQNAAHLADLVDIRNGSDLPPGRPSFITRVLGFDSGRFRVWQARRARCHQVAQASGALLSGSCCPARNAA